MAGLGIGGFGAIGNNFLEGYQQAQDIQFQQTQRKRVLDEQARQDELRSDLRGIKQTEDVEVDNPDYVANPVVKDDEGNDMPAMQSQPQKINQTRKRTDDAILRDYAKAYSKQGDIAKATEYTEKADKIAFLRTGRQVNEIMAGEGDFLSKAKAAATAFHNDPFGGGIEGEPIQNKDGSITLNMIHKDRPGVVTPKTFANEKQLGEALQAHYSPETYQKILDTRMRMQEEALKPYTLRPGETRYIGGKEVATGAVPKGYEPVTMPDGTVVLRPIDGGRGTGTGTKGGKTPVADIEAASKLLGEFLGKSDGSPEGAARQGRAHSMLDPLYQANPGMSPRVAAAIAADASADPSRITPQIDNRTGLIGKVYSNPDFEGGRQFNMAPGSITPEAMEKSVGKTGMVEATTGMIGSMVSVLPPEQRAAASQQLIAVAADPVQRRAYLQAAQEAGKDTTALSRQLDLIGRYHAPPKPETPKDKPVAPSGGQTTTDRLKAGGLYGKALDQAVMEDSRRQLAEQQPERERLAKARAEAAKDPELMKLDQERASLLRAGRAVDANAKIEEWKALRLKRYGF